MLNIAILLREDNFYQNYKLVLNHYMLKVERLDTRIVMRDFPYHSGLPRHQRGELLTISKILDIENQIVCGIKFYIIHI